MATLSYAEAAKAFQDASASGAQSVPAITYAHDWQQNGIDKTTAAVLQRVDQSLAGAVPGLTITSAYRPAAYNAQAGGAPNSQHISGKAIDLDLSSFTPAQKQAVLNAVMAQPEIKGIGVYDKNLNTLHFDTRSGDRVAWGPDYTSKSLGTVLNGYTQPMLTGWLNGAPSAASAATAMATGTPMPPMPNLRQDARALQGVNPYDTAPPAGSLPALAPPPTQLASSWLPKSLQPGGQGYADVMGGMSPLHSYTIPEDSTVAAGPYGADAAVRAAAAGDVAGFNKAMAAIMASATKDALPAFLGGGGLGQDGVVQKLQGYFDTLPSGAVRAMQSAYNANPELQKAIPPQLLPLVQQAFSNLPPQATGQVAMPNLRPPGGPSTPDPLVAGPTPDPLAPKMASFAPPSQPGGFGSGLDPTQLGTLQKLITGGGADSWMPGVARSLSNLVTAPGSQEAPPSPPQWPSFPSGDNLDMRTNPGTANASPVAYAPPAANSAGLAQLLGRGPQSASPPTPPPAPDFGGPFWNPSSAMASPTSPQRGLNPPPSFSPPPFPSLASLNPTQMRGLEGATGQGSIQRPPLTSPGIPNFALPQSAITKPNLRPPMPAMAMAPPMPRPRPAAPATQFAQAPTPMPPPMSPMQAFQAQFGSAPQNVNWQATLAPDPFAQPGTQGTFVLNDLDAERNSIGQTDSYYNLPAFSWA